MIRYAATIFVSAFLLFQVQPLIARYILPWFGGSAGVWSVTLLFFQAVLLGGYAYAHLMISRFSPRMQMIVHLSLLGVCLFTLPVIPPESLKPSGDESPEIRILLLLGVSVGLPYFALAATGPLLQAWFARSYSERSPYALYALSNVGSMLALLSYPFIVETIWGRTAQATNWSWLFAGFAVLCAVVAVTTFRRTSRPVESRPVAESDHPPARPSRRHIVLWAAFAAAGTTLLLAFTNQVCLDVASVPFLWVLPLCLYLLSFIITFAGERWYPRTVMRVLLVPAVIGTISLPLWQAQLPLTWMIAAYLLCLLVCCLVCHGEAFRLRPDARYLTKFYLFISFGGALGGAFVALLAPAVFSLYTELLLGLLILCALVIHRLATEADSALRGFRLRWAWGLIGVLTLGVLGGMGYTVYHQLDDAILATRNFYGVFRVKETGEEYRIRTLYSGTTMHGQQFLAPELKDVATTYYGEHSGVGAVLVSYPREGAMKVGIVGLGVGTLAVYAEAGDTYRFYEINPDVIDLAREHFSYLEQCRGDCEFVLGDARLKMAEEPPQAYDVLVLDAFSSDAIPVHLLTAEAFDLYLSHLKPGGVICVHISNRHLDLQPVVLANAKRLKLGRLVWQSGETELNATAMADWFIITNNVRARDNFRDYLFTLAEQLNEDGLFEAFEPNYGNFVQPNDPTDFRPWTDDYSNLFAIMKD